jgi:amino-acid N-acetyltransferase
MSARAAIRIGQADRADATRIHALITANTDEGRLLPRTVDDIVEHAGRFVAAWRGRRLVACAELAPLSPQVAEVRSLVVDSSVRSLGIGSGIVDEIIARARREGFETLCAFTHAPGYFSHLGFSITPHRWFPDKISADCARCDRYGCCDQIAMAIGLEPVREAADHGRMMSVRTL